MKKKFVHDMKRTRTVEKKQIFGIRKLNVGVASVGIAAALFLSGVGHVVQAEEVSGSADTAPVILSEQTGSAEAVSPLPNAEAVAATNEVPAATTNEAPAAESTSNATAATEAPIEDGSIRLHFETVDNTAPESQGLWTWGGVEDPSNGSQWPHDTVNFSADQVDDYGHYVDIKKSETPGAIGYLLLKDGKKVTENDQKIELLVPEQNEAWIASDYSVSSYEPLKDENTIRINYLRDDNNYEGWGVWTWGDTTEPSKNWPHDALDFTNQGKYGRYVDVPLSKALNSRLEFLLVNQNTSQQTVNLAFGNRTKHSQIFLRNDDTTIYTNPYYVEEKTELDTSKAEAGKENIQLTAQVKQAFHYNESGLLTVNVTNPTNVPIVKMEVDTTQLGGGIVPISPELNRVTINATSAIQPGQYTLPVKAYDKNNGYYETQVQVTITDRNKQAGEKDWDEQVIYFMVTDRFYNGNTSNDNPYNMDYAGAANQRGVYRGGDFKGVTQKLDYLKELGVSAIWVTPIVENISADAGNPTNGEYYAYHGYWAKDFNQLNPHLGTMEEFHELIDQAAERGINIIVDVVLNHAGYGTQDTFGNMVRSKEEDKKGDDQLGSLADLPDFKTENHEVRRQLVDWQTAWLQKSKTQKGNSIYAFRVDTVKHVDDTTWQHFKNELVDKDPDFHLIGETWDANYKDNKGDLGIGTMDSLLDFGFKSIAKQLVNGQMRAANDELTARGQVLTSSASLGQFLGSHDEDGFLYSLGGASVAGNLDKLKLAATMLLTAKGQPVIYYGEELGQSGKNNWPQYDNRYDFAWSQVENSDVHKHYQKLLQFRKDNSLLLARGDNATLAGQDHQGWLLSKRTYENDSAYILYSRNADKREIHLEVSDAATVLRDYYSGREYQATQKDGKWIISLEAPSLSEGGTMLFKASQGSILGAESPIQAEKPIEQGYFRLHFKSLPSDAVGNLGLWLWDDVETPSEKAGKWPTGALSFSQAGQDDYGYYMDIKMSDGFRDQISFLINNTEGKNLTENKHIEVLSQEMNEAWVDKDFNIHSYRLLEAGMIRVNYFRTDGNYDRKGLWVWGDVQTPSDTIGSWPDGVNFEAVGQKGRYVDIALKDLPQSLGFLLVDESKTNDDAKIQPNNYIFTELKKHSQIFLKDNDPTIYTNPYFVNSVRLNGAQHTGVDRLEGNFTTLEGADEASIREKLQVTDKDGQPVTITGITLDAAGKKVLIQGNFDPAKANYTVRYGSDAFTTHMSWQLKDSIYKYEGELGARVKENGSKVAMTLWSPSADAVSVVVYDKDDQSIERGRVSMVKGDKGEWNLELTQSSIAGISDFRGYYYHYEISRGGQTVLVLDPYAKSLAEWNSDLATTSPAYKVAKAAFVDTKEVGPSDLGFADIPNFKQREDAIIYEAHVRDFTSDPAIAGELKAQFGTFASFVERLDYLQKLGVTHIQLLPVMSYYYVNELKNGERLTDYASSNSNYNWGYDPQSYFALTGMYSTDPTDPLKRIEEFKNLVNEIHKRGMGVILDVVYNHTAKTHLFEDLEPNYYHFMEADGTAKTSFGGGRLGTTHYMSRRVMVDSIKYLVDEFKVDGFRFDMMGDHDAASVAEAFAAAKALNPNIIMLGEGWRTFTGDTNQPVAAADQDWMKSTDTVAVFSDDIRNTLKSGYPNEGQPAFLTTGAKNIWGLFNNIKAQPGNFVADDPGDVIQYIAAHDNLTLFDIIAQSIKKDPSKEENYKEIHQRLRLGNLLVLTSQGTPFIHSGQEYGRTKQFRHPDYQGPVTEDKVPNKSHLLTDADGRPFDYPYYIHDSYDSSDAVNKFDWTKATDSERYPENTRSQAYTRGLIELRRSTDAFSLGSKAEVDAKVSLISQPGKDGIGEQDLVIAYQTISSNGVRYAVFVNADSRERSFVLPEHLRDLAQAEVLVDNQMAGIKALTNPSGVRISADRITLDPLTATVLRLGKEIITEVPKDAPTAEELPALDFTTQERVERQVLNFVEEEQEDADLPLGQTKVLREGQAGQIVKVYRDVLVAGQVVATELVSEERTDAVNRLVAKGSLVTQVPDNAPTAEELPALDFTTQERVEHEVLNFVEEEQEDADLPLGQTKVLREGQTGQIVKVYRDVLVAGQVVATEMVSEERTDAVNRLVAKGSLVTQVPDNAPTAEELPALDFQVKERVETEPVTLTEGPDAGKTATLVRTYEDVWVQGQRVSTTLLSEELVTPDIRVTVKGDVVEGIIWEVLDQNHSLPTLDFLVQERTEEEEFPIEEEIRYDETLALGQSYVLQKGQAGKKVLVYQDVVIDGKVVATNLLSETTVDGQYRVVVKGSLAAKKEEVKPSLSPSPIQAPVQPERAASKPTLPATGEEESKLALLGIGLAGLGLTLVAQGRKKKSEE